MSRLDIFLVEKGYFTSRERAKDAILSGVVFVDGKQAKASLSVCGNEEIKIGKTLQYVSRGALKLEKAIKDFDIDLSGKNVLDIGSSTGGFTEICLLNGVKHVIAVDVGNNQMDKKLKNDKRISLFENTDFRFIESEKLKCVDFIVSDVSFISLEKIFPKILHEFGNDIEGVFLFKPQFECGVNLAKKYKGVIKDKNIHKMLLKSFCEYLNTLGFSVANISHSPITGKSGNIEYLVHISKNKQGFDIDNIVEKAFESL